MTTLSAPPEAKKAYESARRKLDQKRPDLQAALKQLEKAVRLHPRFAAAWYLMGETKLTLGQSEPARRALETAVACDQKYAEPYVPLALMALKEGDLKQAAVLTDRALSVNPSLVEAQFYNAVAKHNLGDTESAKRSARAVLDLGKDRLYPRVHAILGEIFANEGDYRSAAAEYRRLLELEPDSRVASTVRLQLSRWEAEGMIGRQ